MSRATRSVLVALEREPKDLATREPVARRGRSSRRIFCAGDALVTYDLVIRGGTIHDGGGGEPFVGDVAVRADAIAEVGRVSERGAAEIDATGLAVAPGFVNMLSHANGALMVDGRSQSDIRQGVTLEVFGEGWLMGPLNDAMRRDALEQQVDIRYDIKWSTLAGQLAEMVRRGISTNVASFVSATNVRINVLGHADRPPSSDELERMRALVREAMAQGALGLATALIYAPATYADTSELVEMSRAVAEFGGMYISHMRSEGSRLLEAIDELVTIARTAAVPAEIYHLKQSGPANWPKIGDAIARVDAAREAGLRITADMYTYAASSTGLDSVIPAWAHEGGHRELVARLQEPATRARIRGEISAVAPGRWDAVRPVSFREPRLQPLIGRTISEIAAERGRDPAETVMDLLAEDASRITSVFFSMSEDNVRREVALPWMSFGSDGASLAPEGDFLRSSTHPRAYGNFARLLARYVRDEAVVALPEAIRRLTSLPASNLRLDRRGRLVRGHFADVVVFDPRTIQDHATFEDPHRYATGVAHVVVNGAPVLRDGEHTGALPGRALAPVARA
ncbi:MAG: amidohydrolase family protein [Candidatus Limnocylindria bacterium]